MLDLGTAQGVIVLLHALSAVAFVAGLAGRWIVLGLAERAADLASMRTLAAAAAPFERLVMVGSFAVLALGIVAAYVQGRPVLGPLQGGRVDWLFVSVVLYLSIIPLVPLVFVPRGRALETAMLEAVERGQVTPPLRAAWADPVVRAAHVYELAAVMAVLVLMLAKPF